MTEQIFFAVVEASVTVSVAAMLVVLLALTAQKRFAAKWRYWVWLVLCVRMLLPVSFALPQAPVTIPAPSQQVVVPRIGEPSVPGNDAWQADASPATGPDLPESDGNDGTAPALPQNSVKNGLSADIQHPAAQPQQPVSYTMTLSSVLAHLWLAGAAVALLLRTVMALWFFSHTRRWNKPVSDAQLNAVFEKLKKELDQAAASKKTMCRDSTLHVVFLHTPCHFGVCILGESFRDLGKN